MSPDLVNTKYFLFVINLITRTKGKYRKGRRLKFSGTKPCLRLNALFHKCSSSSQCGRFSLMLWRLVKGSFFCVFLVRLSPDNIILIYWIKFKCTVINDHEWQLQICPCQPKSGNYQALSPCWCSDTQHFCNIPHHA